MLGNHFKQFQGKIQLSTHKKAIDSLLEFLSDKIVEFPAFFKANTNGKLNEDRTSSALEIFLQRQSRSSDSIFMFQFQTPLEGKRTTNISVLYASPYSSIELFFIIEAKRLPAPEKEREREYVHGELGAMERFTRGYHGKMLEQSAIIGYIEHEDCEPWRKEIKNWINDLIRSNADASIVWDNDDLLTLLTSSMSICTYSSLNKRLELTGITLTQFHLGIN